MENELFSCAIPQLPLADIPLEGLKTVLSLAGIVFVASLSLQIIATWVASRVYG